MALIAVAINVMICGRQCHGLWPSMSWFVALIAVAVNVMICVHQRHGLWPSLLWPSMS